MENTAYKGENMIFWRYLAPRLAEEHALPPHEQIDKDTPRRRSERSEGRGGTGAQPSEKSLSQTLHPGNSKQVHKTTTLPPQQQQTTTNPFAQITTRGDSEDNRRSEINVKELLLHALNGTIFPPQQQTTNTCKGRPKSKTIAEGILPLPNLPCSK